MCVLGLMLTSRLGKVGVDQRGCSLKVPCSLLEEMSLVLCVLGLMLVSRPGKVSVDQRACSLKVSSSY